MGTRTRHIVVVAAFSLVVVSSGPARAQPEDPGALEVAEWDAGGVATAGATIPTRVFYPSDGGGSYPVVGVVHGASRNGSFMRVMAETIASRGCVAVVPDMPCEVYVCDHDANAEQLSALLDWAVAQSSTAGSPIEGLVDGELRGLVGHSWGGLASHLATARDGRIDALVLLDPNDDLGVGARAARDIAVPTMQLLAQSASGCNSMWNEDIITPALGGPYAQLTITRSGHCDPEDPSDALCPLVCGGGARETAPIFRRYAVAWIVCALGIDASVAPWVGGEGLDEDVVTGLVRDPVFGGSDILPCLGVPFPDGDADADLDGDMDLDSDADLHGDTDPDADADVGRDSGLDAGTSPDSGVGADADQPGDIDADHDGEGSPRANHDGCECRVSSLAGVDGGGTVGLALFLIAVGFL
jgi:dienelactone hydrolase